MTSNFTGIRIVLEHKLIVAIASHDEHVNILIITIATKRLLVTMAIPL